MSGLHLVAEWQHCQAPPGAMQEVATLRALCLQVCREAGLAVVAETFHGFAASPGADAKTGSPGESGQTGVTGVVVLAESHLAIHTWPEFACVTLDLYVCNVRADHSAAARAAYRALAQVFQPGKVTCRELERADFATGRDAG